MDKKIFFNKRCYGVVLIKSENSNWNADFTGYPRRLPDENGTIYATDKALKYAIRKFWIDSKLNVFVWKSFFDKNGELLPKSLEKRFIEVSENLKEKDPRKLFSLCIDTKFFGITFAMKSKNKDENMNISLTGPLQISYGINKYYQNIPYVNDILSPYADKEGAKNTTIGNEVKNLKSYYVYDFILNPKNISDHYEDKKELAELYKIDDNDINNLKNALNKSATNLNTTTKIGSENATTLFIVLNEDSKIQLPILKNLIEIKTENQVDYIDLSKIEQLLKNYNKDIESVELYGNENIIKIKNAERKLIDILK